MWQENRLGFFHRKRGQVSEDGNVVLSLLPCWSHRLHSRYIKRDEHSGVSFCISRFVARF